MEEFDLEANKAKKSKQPKALAAYSKCAKGKSKAEAKKECKKKSSVKKTSAPVKKSAPKKK